MPFFGRRNDDIEAEIGRFRDFTLLKNSFSEVNRASVLLDLPPSPVILGFLGFVS